MYSRAVECFLRQRLEANVIVYNAAINALGKGKRWTFALRLLGHMAQEALEANTISCNAVLSGCERSACWQQALLNLWGIEGPSHISFNTALSSCCRSNWEKAFEVFGAMKGFSPDVFTCSALVRACEMGQRWQGALSSLSLCTNALATPNAVVYGAAISACSSCSEWRHALLLFSRMCEAMLPNVISYSAAISACEKGGQWQTSLALLADMKVSKISPDRVIYGAALEACERGMQWPLALHFLLRSMPSETLTPDSLCFISAIRACSESGRWEEIMKLVQTMVQLKVSDFSIARYEHSMKAGTILDCFKHSVFVMFLQRMAAEPSPFTCIDTHSGPGLYDLDPSTRIIQELTAAVELAPSASVDGALQSYAMAVRDVNQEKGRVGYRYLGSPLLALKWLRPQDKAIFYELSKDAYLELKENVESQGREVREVEIHQGNSYWDLAGDLPEAKRGGRRLVLMDPPYEPYESYMAWNLFLLKELYQKWPKETTILMWFPYLNQSQAGLVKAMYSCASQ